jgi:signal transduction histidine kinase/ligand-binding sensor domain-containing protein
MVGTMEKPGHRKLHLTLLFACLASLVMIPGPQAVLAYGPGGDLSTPTVEGPPPALPSVARFDRISTADGLSDQVVYDILQDRRGFIWFATRNGLTRYDGHRFTIYQNDPGDPTSLSSDLVITLYLTRNGDLWIGTLGGLDSFDPTTGIFTHHPPHQPVLAIHEDEAGILWVGTPTGLTHLDPADPEPSAFVYGTSLDDPDRLSGTIVNTIMQDRAGAVWLGTGPRGFSEAAAGLDRYDPATGTFAHYRHDPGDPASLGGGDIRALTQDHQGVLWVGTDGGLNRLDPSSGTFTRYRHDPDDPFSLVNDQVLAILEDSAGRLWVGTSAGLDQFDRSQDRFVHFRHDPEDPHSLSGDLVLSIFEDRSGVVWIGTTAGASRYDETASQFYIYQNRPDSPYRLSDNVVLAVLEDRDGRLWVGTETGGLSRLDRDAGTATIFRHDPADPASLSSDGVTALHEDRAGNLWVGTGNHWLERFDPQTETFDHFWYASAGEPNVIVEDRAGYLWIGTPNGLYRLHPATNTSTHYRATMEPALSMNLVTALHELQDGKLLVGTEGGGVSIWDPQALQFDYLRQDPADPGSLAHDVVYALHEDPAKGLIWIGTWRGLDRFEIATGIATHYTEKDGLAGNAVLSIVVDSAGFLWLTTNRGLSRFDPRTGTFRNYDARDGLPAGRFVVTAHFQGRDGEILLGSTDGLLAFHPDRLPDNPYPPPIAITTLSLFNEVVRRDLPPGEQIELSYEQNFLSFEFAALDYAAPAKNQYAYRLEGVDPDWVYAGTRWRADYPNLAPGDYLFRVKGSNNAGVWNEEGTAVQITVTPPPWGTWWFRGIALMLLVVAVFVAYRLRVRNFRSRSRELERQVTERTAELSQANLLLEGEMAERKRTQEALAQERTSAAVAAERNRLARELHDSATQSLYAVTLYADAATRLLSSGEVESAAGNLSKLRSTAKEALGEMRMLIFELRPPVLEEQGLAAALEARLEAVEGRAGIKTELGVDGVVQPPHDVEEGLYRIAVEALNNALRHAQARCISVSLRFESEAVTLIIADDGLGFDSATSRPGGVGLPGMTERAEQMGAVLAIDSQPGTGTTVRVSVPYISEQGEASQ